MELRHHLWRKLSATIQQDFSGNNPLENPDNKALAVEIEVTVFGSTDSGSPVKKPELKCTGVPLLEEETRAYNVN